VHDVLEADLFLAPLLNAIFRFKFFQDVVHQMAL
jgi:hypothetical protein